jgi:hypothetical protein
MGNALFCLFLFVCLFVCLYFIFVLFFAQIYGNDNILAIEAFPILLIRFNQNRSCSALSRVADSGPYRRGCSGYNTKHGELGKRRNGSTEKVWKVG